ncbi:MAG: type II secretion system protein [Chthoniobacterales bacterium]
MPRNRAFTLIEAGVTMAIIVTLTLVVTKVGHAVYVHSSLATSAANIRNLAAGAAGYLADHNHRFWKFRDDSAEGTTWWWGFESNASKSRGEGNRTFDPSRGPLGDFVPASFRPDPSFALSGSAFKPKFRNGYIGVGYNVLLGGGFFGTSKNPAIPVTYWSLSNPSRVVVFATSAQVYPFSSTPQIEEFYGLDHREKTVHFRHGGNAMVAFANGSSGFLPLDKSTLDKRAPDAKIGRFAPVGSTQYLE